MIELDLQQLRGLFLALLGLMLLTLGFLVVYLVLSGRRTRSRAGRPRAREADLDKVGWLGKIAVAGQTPDYVLALLRDDPGRALQVEVGGARYRSFAEIEDAQLKRQVLEAAMDLVRFTGVLGMESLAPAPLDKTYSWREDVRNEIRDQGRQGSPAPAGEDLEERFLHLLAEVGLASTVDKPSLAAALQQRRAAKQARQESPPSVVDEIEAIVQRRLLLIPALAGRDLHVRQRAEGSVFFLFGGREYEQLDDIPNLTARQLVKDAIQEWEEIA